VAQSEAVKIAERFEPRIRNALLRSFDAMRGKISNAEIVRQLESRGVEGVMSLMDRFDGELGPVQEEVRQALRTSGRATLGVMPKGAILNPSFTFDTLNPSTVDFIRNYELNLIRQISENTKKAVRQGLRRDIVSGQNPRATARTFRANIGLTAKQEMAVFNYRQALENLDSQALKRALRDRRFDSTIKRAIENEKSLSRDQVNSMVDRYRQRYIKYRSEVIGRTESLRATTVGQHAAIQQLVSSGSIDQQRVRRFWIPTRDNRTRNEHFAIPQMNQEGVGLNDSYITPLGPLKYPRDPNGRPENTIQCRCSERFKMVEPGEVPVVTQQGTPMLAPAKAWPSRGTTSRRVWDIADRIVTENPDGWTRKMVIEAAVEAGIKRPTASTQFSRWKQFTGGKPRRVTPPPITPPPPIKPPPIKPPPPVEPPVTPPSKAGWPKPGTTSRTIWDIAGDNPGWTRQQVIEEAVRRGINKATASTQYGKWKKFTSGAVTPPKPGVTPPTKPAPKPKVPPKEKEFAIIRAKEEKVFTETDIWAPSTRLKLFNRFKKRQIKWAKTLAPEELRVEKMRLFKTMLDPNGGGVFSDGDIMNSLDWIPYDVLLELRNRGLRIRFRKTNIRAFYQSHGQFNAGNIEVWEKDTWDVISHEVAHAVDNLYSKQQGTGMKWGNTPFGSTEEGKFLREYFKKQHKGFGKGVYDNGDGLYWKDNWLDDYEGRIYDHSRPGAAGQEFWTMNVQRYARFRGTKSTTAASVQEWAQRVATRQWERVHERYPELARFIERKFSKDFVT
jgi:hypothetical protein